MNDVSAIRSCVEEQGLGFLVLHGAGVMDEDGSFVAWHRALKAAHGVRSQPSNSGRSRQRKAAFVPIRVDAVWIPDLSDLDANIAAGGITIFAQGRQAPGAAGGEGRARKRKYLLTPRGLANLTVARSEWPPYDVSRLTGDRGAPVELDSLW